MRKNVVRLIAGALLFSTVLNGCALGKKAVEYANEGKADEVVEEAFSFVDAHGEMHDTFINKNIAPCEYNKDLFVMDAEKMSYNDSGYETMQGIDVSHHQGEIDWAAVKNAGYDFAILRIGYRGYGEEGTLNADSKFDEYYEGATSAGLKVGAYFFAQAINEEEAKEEADFVYSILNGRLLDLPVVYDPESVLDDEARTDDVSGEQFTANTAKFCQTISDYGYEPMIYANMMWEAFMLDLEELSAYPIWYADYEIPPQTPYAFTCWQYNEKGSVPGVTGDCDQDIWITKK